MPSANLNKETVLVNDGLSAIVVVKDNGDIPGGATLDVSQVEDAEVLYAGHVVIYNPTSKTYAPLPVEEDAYVALPDGYSYAGVLKHSISVKSPLAAILTMGQVNGGACKVAISDAIKAGLPNIQFLYC